MDTPEDAALSRIEALISEIEAAIEQGAWDDVPQFLENVAPLIQHPLSADASKERLGIALDRVRRIEQSTREHMLEISNALTAMSNQRRIAGRYGET